MALTNKADIKITSGSDTITFTPQEYKILYESLAGEDSGRTDDGTMHLSWILTKITKLEITLPPHKYDDERYTQIISYVQGQTYTVEYYDYLEGIWRTTQMYTSNTSATWFNGIVLDGIVQGESFSCIEISGETSTPHKELEPPEYIVTLNTEHTTASGGGTYSAGTLVTVYGSASSGYIWDGWYENGTKVSSSTSYSFTVSRDRTLLAKATVPPTPQYTVSIDAQGCTATGAGTYDSGATATVRATPSTGYVWDGWYINTTKVSSTQEYAFTVTQNTNLIAKCNVAPTWDGLCFTAVEPNSTVELISVGEGGVGSPEYSTNASNWTTFTPSTTAGTNVVTLTNIGDKVYFRNSVYGSYNFSPETHYLNFRMSGKVAASGNCNSMYRAYNYKYEFWIDTSGCFCQLFDGCTSLVSAPELPADDIMPRVYWGMFRNCTNLETIPKLPATSLGIDCYQEMFKGCTKIKISETQSSEYPNEYRFGRTPLDDTVVDIFTGTGGTFTNDPTEQVYYTANEIAKEWKSPYETRWRGNMSIQHEDEEGHIEWSVEGKTLTIDGGFKSWVNTYESISCPDPDGNIYYIRHSGDQTFQTKVYDYQTGWADSAYRLITTTNDPRVLFGQDSDWAKFYEYNGIW